MEVLFLSFWGTSALFSLVVVAIYFPSKEVHGFPHLHILANIYLWLFDNSHPHRCAVIPPCGLICSSLRWVLWVTFSYNCCMSSFETCLSRSFAHFMIELMHSPPPPFVLLLSCVPFTVYFGFYFFIICSVYKYFLPFRRLPLLFVDGFLCWVETFWFDVVPRVYVCFCGLCFGCHTQEIIAQANIRRFPLSFLTKRL